MGAGQYSIAHFRLSRFESFLNRKTHGMLPDGSITFEEVRAAVKKNQR